MPVSESAIALATAAPRGWRANGARNGRPGRAEAVRAAGPAGQSTSGVGAVERAAAGSPSDAVPSAARPCGSSGLWTSR